MELFSIKIRRTFQLVSTIYVARELLLIDNLIGLPVNAIFAGDMFAVRLILLDN